MLVLVTKRVGFNEARINVEMNEWNKLFEKPNAKLETIYEAPNDDKKQPD
jgi:hypothetical protein